VLLSMLARAIAARGQAPPPEIAKKGISRNEI
jgi:hypothetical protein